MERSANIFRFKRFDVINVRSAMKVNTDGVLLGALMTILPSDRRVLDIGTGTGTIALNHHGILLVALGGEEDDVVATLKIVEGVPLVNLLQRNRCLALVETCYETPTLTFGHEALATLLKVGIERRHLVPEVIERAIKKLLRDEEVLLHIILIDGIACLASQDHKLTDHILTREVDTGIGQPRRPP